MIEAFLQGLLDTVALANLTFLLLGVCVGFVIGILPGLGGPVAIALMLPFTFDMTAEASFAFLLGMVSVTATTGELTSILLGVPGEPTAAALVLDGHPMAKRGEAGRAVGASLASSLLGAWFGAFVLAISIPFVRPIVLSFGSPEFFMITIVGLTFVAILGTGNMHKALIAGWFGLLLGMVGLDPQTATQRYTFGVLELWEGFGIVPVAIGLFAIPEMVELAARGTSIAGNATSVGALNGLWRGIRDTFTHWWLVIRCSAIGAFIGLLPGLGGAVAQWIAYGHALQTSKTPEEFGHGSIEGIVGPGSANNSKEGGSLIPTVAFGIPGSATMALLLGAFVLKGLTPGPEMLTDRLTLTMSFVWMIVLGNLAAVAIALLVARQIVLVTKVRGPLVLVVMAVMVLVGAFSARNAFADVVVMLVFGALGTAMVALNWSRAALILGLILAPIAERYLFLSISRYGWGWLGRPMVIALAVVAIAAVVVQARREIEGRRHKAVENR